ncbi:hypothetical protein [Thermanaerovibrio velox]|uniref:hypothetical protein n=1 Tax=Thermanaerovibrio velox TaxID=108007 RepID=UPI0005925CCA|nr:hypothetical protein [Thermanaerovibrio velox]
MKVVFLTHGGGGVGGGHVVRSAALAQGFLRLGVPVGLVGNPGAVEFFSHQGLLGGPGSFFSIEDPFGGGFEDALSFLRSSTPLLCVVDSYQAGEALLDELGSVSPVVVIDDLRSYSVELHCRGVINYSLGADGLGYSSDRCGLMLGPGYALLREPFWGLKSACGARYLVVAGAADPLGVTPQLVRWWNGLGLPAVDVVIGPMADMSTRREAEEAARGAPSVRLLFSPVDLPSRIAGSRGVICTSSVTAYEALGLRKPVVVFQVADNQLATGEAIGRMGLGINLGPWGSWGSEDLRRALDAMFVPPADVVNPRGALRAATELLETFRLNPCHGI